MNFRLRSFKNVSHNFLGRTETRTNSLGRYSGPRIENRSRFLQYMRRECWAFNLNFPYQETNNCDTIFQVALFHLLKFYVCVEIVSRACAWPLTCLTCCVADESSSFVFNHTNTPNTVAPSVNNSRRPVCWSEVLVIQSLVVGLTCDLLFKLQSWRLCVRFISVPFMVPDFLPM
jgi:hypothetical protein